MSEELITGIHAVLAALTRSPERVQALWVSRERRDRRLGEILSAARDADIKVHQVPRATLDRMAGERHQGVAARVQETAVRRAEDLGEFLDALTGAPLLLVLDGVQDPHNLGACLRSAEAAGAHAVIVPRDNSAPLSPVARRAAAGAAESVPFFQVTNLARCLDDLKQRGIWLVGATQDAETELYRADLNGPLALVLGGEGKGLRRLTREHCDVLVGIPMAGAVASLNVSVATGICLFEAVRQRKG
ncbi:MAG: 23S rRNA (guanosine(2251)-2'-O)-methyltransferase RlmB [Gammaproteobacteria bacterium]|nr:MAG: 23S rRNA (guanosine(2251)-2'-O)-methyltransferase RlmB [Gammaproteobacteria bacterium]